MTRRRVATEKLAAMVAELGVLTVVLWLALWAGVRLTGMGVSSWEVLSASLTAGSDALHC